MLKLEYMCRFKGFGLCLAANCSQDALFSYLLLIFQTHKEKYNKTQHFHRLLSVAFGCDREMVMAKLNVCSIWISYKSSLQLALQSLTLNVWAAITLLTTKCD